VATADVSNTIRVLINEDWSSDVADTAIKMRINGHEEFKEILASEITKDRRETEFILQSSFYTTYTEKVTREQICSQGIQINQTMNLEGY
jgi:hypothetical protein